MGLERVRGGVGRFLFGAVGERWVCLQPREEGGKGHRRMEGDHP